MCERRYAGRVNPMVNIEVPLLTSKRSRLLLPFWCVVLCMAACRRDVRETVPIVWAAKPVEITSRELQESFLLRPKFPASLKGKAALEAHLNGMVRYKYLAWAGEEQGLGQSDQVRDRLRWVREQAMREQLLKREVRDAIQVSEEELRRAFLKRRRFIHGRHLYVQSLEEAQLWQARLQQGLSFEDAAQAVYAGLDEDMARTGGRLAPFTWGDMDAHFEAAAWALEPGELSQPVASRWGYHIIRLDSIHLDPMITEVDFNQDRQKVEALLRQRKEDSLSTAFVAKVMKGLEVRVKAESFNLIVQQARQASRRRSGSLPPHNPLSEGEWAAVAQSLQQRAEQPFVLYRGGRWTIADFINRFQAIPPLYRPHPQNPQLFEQELRNMIRDDFLTRRAEKLGLRDDPYVIDRVAQARQDLMAAAMAQRLAGAVTVSDDQVQRFMQHQSVTESAHTEEAVRQAARARLVKVKQDSVISAYVDAWLQGRTVHRDKSELQKVLDALGGEKAAYIAVWQPPAR